MGSEMCIRDSLRGTPGLGRYGRKLGEDLLDYSLSAVFVGSKLQPIESPDLFYRSHAFVGCKATAEANRRVYDIMV